MKKLIMATAHETTKATIAKFGGDYKATFKIVLNQIYASIKERKSIKMIHNFYAVVKNYFKNIKSIWAKLDKKLDNKNKGIITVKYSDYKNKYNSCKTVAESYDKKEKTIEIILTQSNDGWSNLCHSLCYGDCTAHLFV